LNEQNISEKDMRIIQLKISNTDFQKYNMQGGEIKFTDLVDLISREFARKALLECNEISNKMDFQR
jgi:hypothetical protein